MSDQRDDSSEWWKQTLRFATRTDVGMRRTNNQDSRRLVPAPSRRLWRSRGHLFIVADGMGAHAAGELASQIATEIIAQSYLKRTTESPYEALKNAVLDAHLQIKRQGNEDDAFRDMGTTADALTLLPEGAFVAHVGDSRVYRFRAGVLEQLTFDHSLVWEVRRNRKERAKKIPSYIPKNVITRSLGPTENPEVDLEGPFPILAGDTFLLCSDGLSGQVEDDEIAQLLSLLSPEDAADSLVNLANLRGGPDNCTLIVANILRVPDPTAGDEDERGYEKRPALSTASWSLLAGAIGLTLLPPILLLTGARFPAVAAIPLILTALIAWGGFFLAARQTLFHRSARRQVAKPFGHGPYVHISAEPKLAFAQTLRELFRQLREIVKPQTPGLDWHIVDRLEKNTDHYFAAEAYGDTIRSAIQGINLLMKSLKTPDEKRNASKASR